MGSQEDTQSKEAIGFKELTAEIIQLKADNKNTAVILAKLVPEVEGLVSCKATISSHLIDTNAKLDSVVVGLEKITKPFNQGMGFLATTKFLVLGGYYCRGLCALCWNSHNYYNALRAVQRQFRPSYH